MQEEKNKLNVVELIKLVDTYAPAVEFEPSIFFGAEKGRKFPGSKKR